MSQGGTSFWKTTLGVFAGIALAGTCLVGGCFLLLTRGAVSVATEDTENRACAATLTKALDMDTPTRSGNYCYLRGSVKNTCEQAVSYWKVSADLLNAKGEVIDTAWTNDSERLSPGNSKRFEIMHACPPGLKDARTAVSDVRLYRAR